MSTLVIFRHAEAVASKTDDHARPLTPRGRDDAASTGRALQAAMAASVLVLASDATRTVETASLGFAGCAPPVDLRATAALYNATPDAMLQAVREVPGSHETVVIVGHNPGVSALAKLLVADASPDDRAHIQAGMPTAGAVVYSVEGPWSAIGPGSGRVIATLVPDGKSWKG